MIKQTPKTDTTFQRQTSFQIAYHFITEEKEELSHSLWPAPPPNSQTAANTVFIVFEVEVSW